MTSDTKFFARKGYEFDITCTVETHGFVPYTLQIEHNGKILNSTDHMTISDFTFKNDERTKGAITLTIPNIDKARDEGDYKCIVNDSSNNSNSVNAKVTFITSSSFMLYIKNEAETARKGDQYVQFLFKFEAFSPITFYISNPHGKLIARDTDVVNREKHEVVIDRDLIKFRIKFPDVNDFGEYTIIFKITNTKKNFKLVVIGW